MSIVLAKILGIYFFTVSLALLFNPIHFKSLFKKFADDDFFQLLGGVMAILIGATIVSLHNVWILAWPVVITILGFYSILKGFCIIAFPQIIKSIANKLDLSTSFNRIISFLWFLMGVFFIYKGFFNN